MSPVDWILFVLQLWGAASMLATAIGTATAKVAPAFSAKACAIGVDLAKWRGEAEALEPVVAAVLPPGVDGKPPAP
jgi:hypothetical protein